MLSNPLSSLRKYLPGSTTNMAKNGSDEASNSVKSENKEGKREISCNDASGGKDRTLDNKGLSRSVNHQEGTMLNENTPSMIMTKPGSSNTPGGQASGRSNTQDQLATSAKRGTSHFEKDRKYSEAVKGLTQREVGHTKNEKEEAKSNTESAGLHATPVQPDDLRKRLEESEKQRIQLSMELHHGRREKKDLQNKIAEAQREINALHKECDETKEESRQKSKVVDRTMKEIEILGNDIHKAQRQIKNIQSELEVAQCRLKEIAIHRERQDTELQMVRNQLQCSEALHVEARKQLMERTAELQSAQVFIDVVDSLSGADIINMTTALNAEILQVAALITDSLDYTKRRREAPREELEESIGKILTQALIDQKSVDGEDVDPTPVQLALQVCLVHCSKQMIASWTLGNNDKHLSEIYSRIWKEEKQSVAGRWRSMTQMHATIVDGQKQTLQVVNRAVERVLTAANTDDLPSIDQFRERLSGINNLSLKLRSSMKRHVTSLDICPFTVVPGLPFDPSRMDDTYARERKADSMIVEVNEHVAGTTELGLIGYTKDIEGKVETRVMLKPKVVLCSAIDGSLTD